MMMGRFQFVDGALLGHSSCNKESLKASVNTMYMLWRQQTVPSAPFMCKVPFSLAPTTKWWYNCLSDVNVHAAMVFYPLWCHCSCAESCTMLVYINSISDVWIGLSMSYSSLDSALFVFVSLLFTWNLLVASAARSYRRKNYTLKI